MRRTLSNRTVAVMVAVFTVIGAFLLRSNPFGEGTIPWIGAILVSFGANFVLAYLLAGWAAPYVASTGGKQGASAASPRAVAVAENWIAATLMSVGVIAMLAVSFTSRDLIITPTDRLQANAELVSKTVESQAAAQYQSQLTAADTWKLSERMLRTCVPSVDEDALQFCVLVVGEGTDLKVVKYGLGVSNARQFLKWHPEAAR